MTNNPIDPTQEDAENHYQVSVECSNCNFGKDGLLSKSYIWIPNGQKLVETPCKKCECKTLRLNKESYHMTSNNLADE